MRGDVDSWYLLELPTQFFSSFTAGPCFNPCKAAGDNQTRGFSKLQKARNIVNNVKRGSILRDAHEVDVFLRSLFVCFLFEAVTWLSEPVANCPGSMKQCRSSERNA